MKRIKQHADFLSLMHKRHNIPGDRRKLIKLANKNEINACCEIYLNALQGNIHITPRLAKALKKHQRQCRDIVDRTVSLNRKKRILAGQTGGFLGPLLGAIVGPLIKGVVGSFVGGRR